MQDTFGVGVGAHAPVHLSLFTGQCFIALCCRRCFCRTEVIDIVLQDGQASLVSFLTNPSEQNNTIEDSLIHEFLQIWLIGIQFRDFLSSFEAMLSCWLCHVLSWQCSPPPTTKENSPALLPFDAKSFIVIISPLLIILLSPFKYSTHLKDSRFLGVGQFFRGSIILRRRQLYN